MRHLCLIMGMCVFNCRSIRHFDWSWLHLICIGSIILPSWRKPTAILDSICLGGIIFLTHIENKFGHGKRPEIDRELKILVTTAAIFRPGSAYDTPGRQPPMFCKCCFIFVWCAFGCVGLRECVFLVNIGELCMLVSLKVYFEFCGPISWPVPMFENACKQKLNVCLM